jgi:beta-glucosidase-like glycosyl hydrolase/CubicO group peptidase (beta-lactamase class C family)
MRYLFISLVITLCGHSIYAQGIQRTDSLWADSVFRQLSPEQRIAQLFMIRAFSYKDSIYQDSLNSVVEKYQPGGICFFKGSPYAQVSLTNRLQKTSKVPLLVAIDAEWGLGMRLDSAFAFPRPITCGAVSDDTLLYRMGALIAKDCRRMGIHMNLAPVADINSNPDNPVINFRSFGENKFLVARKSLNYMKGIQDNGIMAVAKHFPGHGDTDMDSHLTLPVIKHTRARMDSVELFPFKALISNGLEGMMIGHLFLPCYDSGENIAATLSYSIVTKLLRDGLGFNGFIITDALDMQGVTKYFKPGEIELKALQAGNDILLLPLHIEEAITKIRTAADSNIISWSTINKKCFHLLMLKSGLGANRNAISARNLYSDLNPRSSELLQKQIFASALTLVKNELGLLPFNFLDKRSFAYLGIGETEGCAFHEALNKYAGIDPYYLPLKSEPKLRDSLVKVLNNYNILIIGLHKMTGYPADSFNLSRQALLLVDTLSKTNRTVLVLFGNPYALRLLKQPIRSESVLVAYQDFPVTQELSAELLFGGIPALGKLPVSSANFKSGCGEETEHTRLCRIFPEETGLTDESLKVIDSIALSGIEQKAYPGCQVLFAKDGKVFYNKSFGHPVYGDSVKVVPSDLYDLASVTKIAATTLAVMKLSDEGKLSPGDSLGQFLPRLRNTNKAGLTIRDIMTHRSGLQAWIPFYKTATGAGGRDTGILRTDSSRDFSIKISDHLYMNRAFTDSIYQMIIRSPLGEAGKYLYSDLGFYLLRLVVEKLSGKSFPGYLDENFYKPLGLQRTSFNPLNKFPITHIIPTENDIEFRHQLVHGYVHDPGAAMLGGISGHAGLFSNAADLAVIMQMLLQGGSYGGKQYLRPATVKEFTSSQFPGSGNRRGLGFDKPLQKYREDSPACRSASQLSFGHSGFTGTFAWADPANGLVYIFLSNRVYPSAGNQKLKDLNIRTNIQQAVYDLFEKFGVK